MIDTVLRLCAQTAPLLIAAFAALFSEHAGMLNIGIEGFMLIGAFSGIAAAAVSSSFSGMAAGVTAACIAGGLFIGCGAYYALKYRANIYIIGLAVNLLAAGLVSAAGTKLFENSSIISLPDSLIPDPFILKSGITVLSVLLTAALLRGAFHTRAGIHIRILGTDTEFLESIGVDTVHLKIIAMGISGAAAVLAGSLLSLQLGSFVPNHSGGRGWIALILVYAGGKSIAGIVCAAFAFVLIENSIAAAQIGVEHPALLIGLPFILGLLLIITEKTVKKLITLFVKKR